MIHCDANQLAEIGEMLDSALTALELHRRYMGIVDVSNHLCLDETNQRQRRLTWHLSSRYVYVYIFIGGGRCRYCWYDYYDRRQMEGTTTTTNDYVPQLRGNDPDLEEPDFLADERGEEPMEYDDDADMEAFLAEPHWFDREEEEDIGEEDEEDEAEFVEEEYEDDEQQQQPLAQLDSRRRRLQRSCGCQTLDFTVNREGEVITGTPYVHLKEFAWRYGVKVWVTLPRVGGRVRGYAPNKQARIYDTSRYVKNDYEGDPDLGSPNKKCEGGGPGVGSHGGPFLPDSDRRNPGANCRSQGNVLIIQESNKRFADDSVDGGYLNFEFSQGPVTLNHIGLMDIGDNDVKTTVRIEYKVDGRIRVKHFSPQRYGDNSVETLRIGLKHVTKIRVQFQKSGAVSWLSYCHEGANTHCPGAAPLVMTSTGTARLNANREAVKFEEHLVPVIEADAEAALNAALADQVANNDNYCLKKVPVDVGVQMLLKTAKDLSCQVR